MGRTLHSYTVRPSVQPYTVRPGVPGRAIQHEIVLMQHEASFPVLVHHETDVLAIMIHQQTQGSSHSHTMP